MNGGKFVKAVPLMGTTVQCNLNGGQFVKAVPLMGTIQCTLNGGQFVKAVPLMGLQCTLQGWQFVKAVPLMGDPPEDPTSSCRVVVFDARKLMIRVPMKKKHHCVMLSLRNAPLPGFKNVLKR